MIIRFNWMYETFAIIAFLLSLVAIVFVSNAVRHTERKNEKFVEKHVEILTEAIEKNVRKIESQNEQISKLNVLIDGTLDSQRKILEKQNLNSEGIEELRKDLKALDASIPPRFRTH